jgi:hypothetical protein
LDAFRDRKVPKLANLHRARKSKIRIPEPTFWCEASVVARVSRQELAFLRPPIDPPLIVRSASALEDSTASSNAGRFCSVAVPEERDFAAALRRVVDSMLLSGGCHQGFVFVQPLIVAPIAGITFFDGFYFEETSAPGGNADLTAGERRGTVSRGHMAPGDARSQWLQRVARVFGDRLDLEWAQLESGERVLLQARPALFPIRRNPILSLANHKEVFGDPPSPWMLSVIAAASPAVLHYFDSVEPAVATWNELYAIELGERPWINFSVFFRLMDHWGLPRLMVTESIGGDVPSTRAGATNLPRLISKLPTLARIAAKNWATAVTMNRKLKALHSAVGGANGLAELHEVYVRATITSFQINLALIQIQSVCARIRHALGMRSSANVVTWEMMDAYSRLATLPSEGERARGLDEWLGSAKK